MQISAPNLVAVQTGTLAQPRQQTAAAAEAARPAKPFAPKAFVEASANPVAQTAPPDQQAVPRPPGSILDIRV